MNASSILPENEQGVQQRENRPQKRHRPYEGGYHNAKTDYSAETKGVSVVGDNPYRNHALSYCHTLVEEQFCLIYKQSQNRRQTGKNPCRDETIVLQPGPHSGQ